MAGPDPVSRAPFVAPVRPRNLLWIAVLCAAAGALVNYGTPHLRVTYVYSGSYERPHYHRCFYWGVHPFEVAPQNGSCPILVLAHAREAR
ncbi:hypothetical protein HB662_28000 [Roseomonas frigidaquae]|uniref:Uncharacterized protein n=1 Tax=Falsiroseomonas frigidaquae TaxID=487318 RepID=A0ABX1F8G2_9PROT|nr:hypothetical protein [Falsiroseomonas frigidaquae]NKE48642.1 hypothetical protein [Falsiroseomonas frigidaquae]